MTDLPSLVKGELTIGKVQCIRCHKKVVSEHYASVHMLNEISCADCHSDIHTVSYWKNDKRKVVEKCRQCHDKESTEYLQSVHGKAVAAGSKDSPACSDCHGLHEIKPLGDQNSAGHKKFHSQVCMRCHSDAEMMKRNGGDVELNAQSPAGWTRVQVTDPQGKDARRRSAVSRPSSSSPVTVETR